MNILVGNDDVGVERSPKKKKMKGHQEMSD
jgi:hypothetical protein